MQSRIRLGSGLILLVFVSTHFFNHMLGLVSLQAAEAARAIFHVLWGSVPGGVLLYGALATHFVLALAVLYRRRTLRMPPWELAQLTLGILFVPLIATHAVAMRGGEELLGISHEYARTVIFIWSSASETAKQAALVLVTWLHAAIGLHFWLRLRPGYRRLTHVWTALYTLVPVLTLLGLYQSARESERLPGSVVRASMERLGASLPDYAAFVEAGSLIVWAVTGALLAVTMAARLVRALIKERAATFLVEHPGAGGLRGQMGQTILEVLRTHAVPHASVCGGRGRCTTCRVRIGNGLDALPVPNDLERSALERICAEPTVRLACQTRPESGVTIAPLVQPRAAVAATGQRGGVAGTERVISVLFVDLRGSTKLGQARLPYDVLFILNQFFSEMAESLQVTQGHYAQFNGDGLMAIYGRDGEVREGARAAIRGGLEMLRRLDGLNRHLSDELSEPLKIGVGVHTGEAIVGTMGPPESPIFSAIGDNINVAARLEGLTKALGCSVVVSADTLERAELNGASLRAESVAIRGRTGDFPVYAIDDPDSLARQLEH